MNTLDAIQTRRSTRRFLPKLISKDIISTVVEAGRNAPSGGNSQSTHFIVITNRDILTKLENEVQKAFAQKEVTPGMYKSMVHSITASKNGNYIYDYSAPVLVITANQKDYGNNIADCACALENMMIAANELNLGSCWINQLRWLNEEPAILNELFNLGMRDSERVYGALALGYADTSDGLPNRKALEKTGNIVTWIE